MVYILVQIYCGSFEKVIPYQDNQKAQRSFKELTGLHYDDIAWARRQRHTYKDANQILENYTTSDWYGTDIYAEELQ